MIRLALSYEVECWSIKKQHMQKMSMAEMRMLRCMCCKTKKDKIRNKCIQEHLVVALVDDKLNDTSSKWIGHVQHRQTMVPVKRSFSMRIDGPSRKLSKPKMTWMVTVRIDLHKCNLSEDLAQDRLEWRNNIHVDWNGEIKFIMSV
eukprot:TRINITY_DN16854_c0_g1_i2.p1 TRINITY_DN16854_c0_g1~~TRINITY_DN16854_c0_g1_i2.p1  ORF type:complete len:146 (-),score=8.65 TRINITY_DN16854_c0_g1_i2:94-531(-)